MKVSIVSAWNELPDSALRLLATAGEDCLFCGESWFALFSHQVAEPEHSPCWLLLNNGDATELILPMMVRQEGKARTLHSLSNYYTPYFSPAAAPGHCAGLLRTLFELADGFLREFDAVEFSPLTDHTKDTLLEASQGLRFSPVLQIQTYNWRQTGIKDFTQYWATRSSLLRNTVRRKERKLDALGGFRFSIAKADEIEQVIDDYRLVYSNSWKPAENFPEFIADLIRVYSVDGRLRLGLAHHDDRPIAAQIWLVNADTAYIYKLAYDQEYRELSVGTLLTHYLAKSVIDDDRVHTVDYLTGDDSYKAQWMSERRPLYRLTLANPRRPKGAVLALKHKLRQMMRRNSSLRHQRDRPSSAKQTGP